MAFGECNTGKYVGLGGCVGGSDSTGSIRKGKAAGRWVAYFSQSVIVMFPGTCYVGRDLWLQIVFLL